MADPTPPGIPREDPPSRYAAFVSYSHLDGVWGRRLHRFLEAYRVPRRLRGSAGRDGPVPTTLHPCFLDREELPSSADLSGNVHAALAQSRTLIVVCSPRSAASRWVDEEVRTFKALGREDRVLCLIVDGEPNATERPGRGRSECFPEAVRHRVGPDGRLTPLRVEPVAADVRSGKDGWRSARLKLVAGVLGIRYGDLRRRDVVRRRWRWALGVAAALLLGGGAFVAWRAQEAVRVREAVAARIGRLTEAGREEVLLGHPGRAAPSLAEARRLGGEGTALRVLLAHALRPLEAEVVRVHDHTGAVNVVRFRPDGQRLLSASDDGTARVFEVPSGRWVATLPHPKGFVRGAEFARSGHRLLTQATDDRARVWDGDAFALLCEVEGEVSTLSPDGTFVATSLRGVPRVFDAATGALRVTLAGTYRHLAALEVSPDGTRIVGSGDRVELEWDATTGAVLSSRPERGGGAAVALRAPDGLRVLVRDGPFAEVRTPSGDAGPVALPGSGAFLTDATYSADGARIAAADTEGGIAVHDAATGQTLHRLSGHRGAVASVRFSPDGAFVASAGVDRTVRLWSLARPLVTALLPGATEGPSVAIFHPDGARVLAVGHRLTAWDVATQRLLSTHDPHAAWGARFVAVSPDGRRVATASEDRTAKVLELATGALVATCTEHGARVLSVAFDPTGTRVVTAGMDHAARVWDARTGAPLLACRSGAGQPSHAVFSPDGTLVAVAASDAITLFDARTGAAIRSLDSGGRGGRFVAFRRDGARIAVAEGDGAGVYAVASGRRLVACEGHRAAVSSVAFAPDGALLVTASSDASAGLFDATTGRPLFFLRGPAGDVLHAAFSPNGRSVVTASGDGTVRVYDVGPHEAGAASAARWVRERGPWKLLDDRLVPADPER